MTSILHGVGGGGLCLANVMSGIWFCQGSFDLKKSCKFTIKKYRRFTATNNNQNHILTTSIASHQTEPYPKKQHHSNQNYFSPTRSTSCQSEPLPTNQNHILPIRTTSNQPEPHPNTTRTLSQLPEPFLTTRSKFCQPTPLPTDQNYSSH